MWDYGDVVTRREVLGLSPIETPSPAGPWDRQAWLEIPVYVVEDTPDQLVTFIADRIGQ